ncbi:hypothetical protein KMC07_gp099 [Escherichia phage vB_EcoM_G8]|uniref:Uncharacterized protein n=1 Tax=Escherichia phage vB_EcoM_G8 TaxID=2508179 RepID=A0A482N2K4_9CAUD|nr:hypothetical protein KMC07_gp099 [Escherichia phage vB_EcoM_G8]QBQ79984.1 hypothetical protein G8_00100 [Escherichia phage vB_EcoM_G8]
MLTREQFEKIIKLARDIEIDSYQLAVEHCEGYSYDGIEAAKKDLDKSKAKLVQYLEMIRWNNENCS